MLVQGLPTSPALWRHVVPLVSAGRCPAPELLGYGDSIPTGPGRDLGGGVAQVVATRRADPGAGLLLSDCIG